MYGILAIDFSAKGLGAVLCTGATPDYIATYPTREEATKEAATLTEWYQKDIRANVVYSAVPIPTYKGE